MWLSCWLVACRSVPLPEVPIVGGTPELRDHVRDYLLLFDEAVGPGRVELRRVEIEPEGDEYAGYYHHRTRTVVLAETAWPLGHTVNHELAHALVHQAELELGATAATDALAELWDGEEVSFSEAVSTIAESGPYWAADVVRDVCPPNEHMQVDPELSRDVAAWMVDHFWSGFVLPEPLVLDVGVATGVYQIERISPTTDPGVVLVEIEGGAEQHLDLYDGSPVVSDLPALEDARSLPPGVHAYTPNIAAGWPEGPAVLVGNWIPTPLAGGGPARVLAHDGERWRFVGEGCGSYGQLAFTADDQVWLAWPDGGYRWAAVGRR